MTQRHVLYLARTAVGGAAFSLYHLAKGLQRFAPVILFYRQDGTHIVDRLTQAGVKVIVLKRAIPSSAPLPPRRRRPRNIGGWLEARSGKLAGQVYRFCKAVYVFLRQDVPLIWPTVRAIRESQASLVHLNNGLRHGKPGILAAWFTRTPCICHVRSFEDLGEFDKLLAPLVQRYVHISQPVADHFVVQGIPRDRGVVVHNAIDPADFADNEREELQERIRVEFGWSRDTRVVGIVGRLDWWKGHEYFLGALAEILRTIPDVKGLIVGEPEYTPRNWEYYQSLLRLTESLGLRDHVVFTGFRSDVPRLLAALDVFVLSSSTPEPFGRVLIEAMAAACPVVATAAGGVLDIVVDGQTGLLVPPRDSLKLAETVLWLLQSPEQARRMGHAARQAAREKFAVQAHVAKIEQLYDSVLSALHAAPPTLAAAEK